ncbi:Inherit from NOG: Glutathione S-transferase N-terminal domain [Seminavis robusta]|uniref:Inherit from NOG: Glutathione S-transferase N-terminal domain n=1 Tax=Seminavis robusta TaxID=568900 RepID=A0A9N8DM62_9STRA|nr:Inherit from NOG: Glutathione S-transferase N-terminal domain [Seminavis robusta]|eukprot:Sro132_g062640.1 Inherit from NOG: Glutathione S-transferase N-terminal domain (339) ;mRNA; f:65038-66054
MVRLSFAFLLLSAIQAGAFVPSQSSTKSATTLQANFFEQLTKPSTPKVAVPEDFVIPEPRPLAIAEGTDIGKFLSAAAALAARLGTGAFVLGWQIDDLNYQGEGYSLKLGPLSLRDSSSILTEAPRPDKPLILYAYDASPYCKIVRETLNLLDLTFEYRPCPGARQGKFSQEMLQKTGRQTVPFLVDPNTNVELFESADIINYLVETYGPSPDSFDRKALWPITTQGFAVGTATTAAILLDMPGARRQANARPDNEDMQSLEVWAYECSPFCRPVFDKLCSLSLPHRVVSCSRGSANRDKLFQKTGRFQVPYLVDPNTGVEMYESNAIVDYLEKTYTV